MPSLFTGGPLNRRLAKVKICPKIVALDFFVNFNLWLIHPLSLKYETFFVLLIFKWTIASIALDAIFFKC